MRYVFMRYPEGKAKAVTFSYDDGGRHDKHLAEIFDKYGMKATFNFNNVRYTGENYTKQQMKELFISKGHEIAVHGAFHRANGSVRAIEGIRDVLDCRLELEERLGMIVRGMAYPDTGVERISNFVPYEQIKKYLTDLDIAYARTLGGDNNAFMLPDDFHRWIPTAHHDNPKIMAYIDEFLALDVSPKVYHPKRMPRLLYIWGHSYEFDKKNNWAHIEQICEKLSGNDELWYATNMEIFNYVQGYRRLEYSADGRLVYNPNLFAIWIDVDGKPYHIEPGETICLEEQ